MSGFPRNRIASIGGSGVDTLGGEIATLDSTGAVRNVLDDGSGLGLAGFAPGSANVQVANHQQPSSATPGVYLGYDATGGSPRVQLANGNTNYQFDNYNNVFRIYLPDAPPLFVAEGLNNLVSVSANLQVSEAVNSSIGQTTLTGSTAGSIVWSMPFQGPSYKKLLAYLDGYENDTTTAQTISYPTAFTEVPVISTNSASVPGVTTTATELSIDPDTTTAYTGWVIVEGY